MIGGNRIEAGNFGGKESDFPKFQIDFVEDKEVQHYTRIGCNLRTTKVDIIIVSSTLKSEIGSDTF